MGHSEHTHSSPFHDGTAILELHHFFHLSALYYSSLLARPYYPSNVKNILFSFFQEHFLDLPQRLSPLGQVLFVKTYKNLPFKTII